MKIFNNNFFLLGNLAFIVLAIPVAMYLIKSQTTIQGRASDTNPPVITSEENVNQNTSLTTSTDLAISEKSSIPSEENTQGKNILFAVIGGILIISSLGIFLFAFRI